MADKPRLYPEDQAKVDEYIRRGYNSVERKPFRPIFLLILVLVSVTSFTLLSLYLASTVGAY